MIKNLDKKKHRVKVYILTKDEDREAYEEKLNLHEEGKIVIYRDNFTYDKSGKPIVTIWWSEEE